MTYSRIRSQGTAPLVPRGGLMLYALTGLAAGGISFALGQSQNFDVFRVAAHTLLTHGDLYAKNASDYFKYSPTFALGFALLAWMPPWVGALGWALANFVAAFVGMCVLVQQQARVRVVLAVAWVGIVLATDGDQSNLLVVGAVLGGWAALERGAPRTAATLLAVAGFIKVFPFACAVMALLYPAPARRRFFATLLVSSLALFAAPLLVLSPQELGHEYASWLALLARDHAYRGWAVTTLVDSALRDAPSKLAVQCAGLAVEALPWIVAYRRGTSPRTRIMLGTSLLVFVVLFNHRAEYATFVLVAAALAIWIAVQERSFARVALVGLVFLSVGPILASAEPTLRGPWAWLGAHRQYHALRVVPTLAAWLWIKRDLAAEYIHMAWSWREGRHAS